MGQESKIPRTSRRVAQESSCAKLAYEPRLELIARHESFQQLSIRIAVSCFAITCISVSKVAGFGLASRLNHICQ